MNARTRAVVVPALVALVCGGTGVVASVAASPLPAKAAKLTVHAGGTTAGIDAALTPGAAIAGRVTDTHNNPLQSVQVSVLTASGQGRGYASTDSSGNYVISSLPPTTSGYAVCMSGTNASSATLPVSYGYVSQCIGSNRMWWSGQRPPSNATFIATAVSTTATADAVLADGGAISGKITSRASGQKLPGEYVYVYGPHGFAVSPNYANDGTYQFPGLASGLYRVCVEAPYQTSAHSTGYLPQCYRNVLWTENGKPASRAVRVSVAPDAATTVNQTLPRAGAISGSVRSTTKPAHPIFDAIVEAFSAGKYVNSTSPERDGTYRLTNLRPGKYKVCAYRFDRLILVERSVGLNQRSRLDARHSGSFSARDAATVRSEASSAQCWKNVARHGRKVPKNARTVHVHTARTTSGISFRLAKQAPGSGISGRITGPSGGGVAQATVVAYRSGGKYVSDVLSGKRGRYRLRLPASPKTGYEVCARGPRLLTVNTAAAARALGARCWKDVPWTGTTGPKKTPLVTVKRGHTRRGISIQLPAAGQITGQVSFGGQPVRDVEVFAFDNSGRFVSLGETDDNGDYTLPAISPAKHAYRVCFLTTQYSTPPTLSPTYGFRPQCFRNQPWNESGLF